MLDQSKIIRCDVLDNYRLSLVFEDGLVGVVDLSYLVGKGVFKIWDNYEEFKQVNIDPITKTICWKDQIDLDPINLRKRIIEQNAAKK